MKQSITAMVIGTILLGASVKNGISLQEDYNRSLNNSIGESYPVISSLSEDIAISDNFSKGADLLIEDQLLNEMMLMSISDYKSMKKEPFVLMDLNSFIDTDPLYNKGNNMDDMNGDFPIEDDAVSDEGGTVSPEEIIVKDTVSRKEAEEEAAREKERVQKEKEKRKKQKEKEKKEKERLEKEKEAEEKRKKKVLKELEALWDGEMLSYVSCLSDEEKYLITNSSPEVPNDEEGCLSYKHTYMPYTSVKSKNTMQYKILYSDYAWSDEETGLRMYGDMPCIAIGLGYGAVAGNMVDVYMENGSVLRCMVGDIKAIIHTDETGKYQNMDGSVTEYIIDEDIFQGTEYYPEKMKGKVSRIEVVR